MFENSQVGLPSLSPSMGADQQAFPGSPWGQSRPLGRSPSRLRPLKSRCWAPGVPGVLSRHSFAEQRMVCRSPPGEAGEGRSQKACDSEEGGSSRCQSEDGLLNAFRLVWEVLAVFASFCLLCSYTWELSIILLLEKCFRTYILKAAK